MKTLTILSTVLMMSLLLLMVMLVVFLAVSDGNAALAQYSATGGGTTGGTSTGTSGTTSGTPATGFPVALVLAGGALASGVGALLVRRSRK